MTVAKERFIMIKHVYTEPTNINFSKLEERIMNLNNPNLGKHNDIRKMVEEIIRSKKPTLIMATGGSKVVAYYLQLILERLGHTICEVIEPRDFFHKENRDAFSNLITISASGKTNGIKDALRIFEGKKYLICEKEKSVDNADKADNIDYHVISWGNENCEKEKSFISLATSLGPMALLLDSTISLEKELSESGIRKINDKIKKLLEKSEAKIEKLPINFKDISLIQIMSGYETKTSSSVLESNLAEVGLAAPVIHDKGSFCHGRSNLLFQYPDSHVIYLAHELKELDHILIDSIDKEYSNLSIFDTNDLEENIFWKEYYLTLQMHFLSKKIATDKDIDLTMPEYNPKLVKKIYTYKGEM